MNGRSQETLRSVATPRAPSPVAPGADPAHGRSNLLRTKDGLRLVLRPVRPTDGEALQAYVRGLSLESRYSRFLGAVSELAPAELSRALAANGQDRLTLLVVSQHDPSTVVGEARVALSCAERAGEFALSTADAWQGLGIGSALIEAIERLAAADGIARLVGDVLRSNGRMIALARARGFRVDPGAEGRLVRIVKPLDDVAADLPCGKWAEAAGAESRAR